MGLIKVASDILGAGVQGLSGAFQSGLWVEYFEAGAFEPDVLMQRGHKVTADGNKNTRADNNLISSGSGIDVIDGTCALIVDNGAVVDFVAEPGRYTYDSSSAPSLFCGENKGLKAMGQEILKQWKTGGQRFSTQRIYFVKTNDLTDAPILWGFGNISFRHYEEYPGVGYISQTVQLKGHGTTTAKIGDPVSFYKKYAAAKVAGGDNDGIVKLSETGLQTTFKTDVNDALGKSLQQIGVKYKIPYDSIMTYSDEIVADVNNHLNNKSFKQAGFEVVSLAVDGAFTPDDKSMEAIADKQSKFMMAQNANIANYDIQKTMAEGFKEAGKNGGTSGLMGMGFAMGQNQGLGQMQFQAAPNAPQAQPQQAPAQAAPQPAVAVAPAPAAPAADTWTCECGVVNDGKFCKGCGKKKPEPVVSAETWTCECGVVNDGKFCKGCGKKRPAGPKHFKCDKCGYEGVIDPDTRFCPDCGDAINEDDFV